MVLLYQQKHAYTKYTHTHTHSSSVVDWEIVVGVLKVFISVVQGDVGAVSVVVGLMLLMCCCFCCRLYFVST